MEFLNFINSQRDFITTVSAIISPLILVYISARLNARSDLEKALNKRKVEVLRNFIEQIQKLLLHPEKIDEINDSLEKNRVNLITVASLQTIKAFNNYIIVAARQKEKKIPTSKSQTKEIVGELDKVLYYLRRDIGIEDWGYSNSIINTIKNVFINLFTLEFLHPKERYDRVQILLSYNIDKEIGSYTGTGWRVIIALLIVLIILTKIIWF